MRGIAVKDDRLQSEKQSIIVSRCVTYSEVRKSSYLIEIYGIPYQASLGRAGTSTGTGKKKLAPPVLAGSLGQTKWLEYGILAWVGLGPRLDSGAGGKTN